MQGIAGCFLIETDVVERPKNSLTLHNRRSTLVRRSSSLVYSCVAGDQLDVSFDIVLLPKPPLSPHFFDSKFDSGLHDRGAVSETA